MEQAGVPVEQLLPIAGGERVQLAPDVTVTAFPSQHSCVWSQTKMTDADEVCIGDLGLTYQEQQARFATLAEWFGTLDADVQAHLGASYQGARGDGGALVFHFETPAGSLFYQDTSGHWSRILRALRPTSPSSPRPGAATSTASPCRAPWPASSRGKRTCCDHGASF